MLKERFTKDITRLSAMDTWECNGYVVIKKWHPRYWLNYFDIPVSVHWWLTFSEFWKNIKDRGVEWIQDDDYIIWFDTAHLWDNRVNWSKKNVEKETKKLLKQVKKARK